MKSMDNAHSLKKKEGMVLIADEAVIRTSMDRSWSKIAPFWPLKNLVAVNPLSGFEDLPFEEALKQTSVYFQSKDMPEGIRHVNRESIKWLQAFFDEGQSTIQMPHRQFGFFKALLSLLPFDPKVHNNDPQKVKWIESLSQTPEKVIADCLVHLEIPVDEQELFLTLMLTTLHGWAAHIQYRTNWADETDAKHPYPITQEGYLAFRLLLTCLLYPEAKELLSWHKERLNNADVAEEYRKISKREETYQKELIKRLESSSFPKKRAKIKAQLVFCIDVRSEPFRYALEAQGDYETYGFAGFFGVPVSVENSVTGDSYASCPVLLKPAHNVVEYPSCSLESCQNGQETLWGIKKIYQSLKYTFATPFCLVEMMGPLSGFWMGLKTLLPLKAEALQSSWKKTVIPNYTLNPDIQSIPLDQQVAYSSRGLKMMGLTKDFAPLVVFCGHGSTTQNNAYATALDCGACGGHHGAPNARILAAILNSTLVREALKKQGIEIPSDTLFLAGKHNTTTDELEIYSEAAPSSHSSQINSLKKDLEKARDQNSEWRSGEMEVSTTPEKASKEMALRSKDWAQVRPEWGLARNASFIVGPRWLTEQVSLEGQSFLHSYDWKQDSDRSSLTGILTAPMIVTQWINAQYFFSSLDPVAYGGGNKVTKNITGKIGVMQGNASDLMSGLPLQSVFKTDSEPYHQPMRLTVVVYAPQSHIDPIIKEHAILQTLFEKGWVHLICYEKELKQRYLLNRDLTWTELKA